MNSLGQNMNTKEQGDYNPLVVIHLKDRSQSSRICVGVNEQCLLEGSQPLLLLFFRTVQPEDKSFAVGIQFMLLRVLGK